MGYGAISLTYLPMSCAVAGTDLVYAAKAMHLPACYATFCTDLAYAATSALSATELVLAASASATEGAYLGRKNVRRNQKQFLLDGTNSRQDEFHFFFFVVVQTYREILLPVPYLVSGTPHAKSQYRIWCPVLTCGMRLPGKGVYFHTTGENREITGTDRPECEVKCKT
eukprot:3940955-Rhodomonas_salina.3